MSHKEEFLAQYGHSGHIDHALKSKDDEIRSAVARNPALPEEHMDKIMSDKHDWAGRWGLSQNPSTPEDIVHVLTRHKDGELQLHALTHPNVPPEAVYAAMKNPSTWAGAIEHMVKKSPHITKEHLENVLADKSGKMHHYIRQAATERLKEFK